MNQFLNMLTVWATTRAAGITSYLFLFLSTATGIIMSMKMLKGRAKGLLAGIHYSTGWFGFLFGLLHGVVLLFDHYVGYTLTELLIPFTSHSHPVLVGLGTLSFYAVLAVTLSSDLIKRLGKKVWRSIHFLAYPAFFMGLIHGFLIGTDSQYRGVQAMYWITAVIVVIMTILRSAAVKSGQQASQTAQTGGA